MDTVRGHKDLVLRRRSCIFVSSYHLSSATHGSYIGRQT